MTADQYRILLSGPLTRNGGFTVTVSGSVTARSIDHMIRQLTLVRDWFEEDERAAAKAPATSDRASEACEGNEIDWMIPRGNEAQEA